MFKEFKTEAIILKKYKYLEKGYYVDFLTNDFGRLSIFVRGLGSTKNNTHGNLELMSIVNLILEKRENFKIKNISNKENFLNISQNPESYTYAHVLSEFTLKLIPEEHQIDGYFELVEMTLKILNIKDLNNQYTKCILISFLIKALNLLGYIKFKKYCDKCSQKINDNFFIDKENLHFICQNCCIEKIELNNIIIKKIKFENLKLFHFLSTESIQSIKKIRLNNFETFDEIKDLINISSNILSDTNFKTFKFFEDLTAHMEFHKIREQPLQSL